LENEKFNGGKNEECLYLGSKYEPQSSKTLMDVFGTFFDFCKTKFLMYERAELGYMHYLGILHVAYARLTTKNSGFNPATQQCGLCGIFFSLNRMFGRFINGILSFIFDIVSM